jgi:hypothetical protein
LSFQMIVNSRRTDRSGFGRVQLRSPREAFEFLAFGLGA